MYRTKNSDEKKTKENGCKDSYFPFFTINPAQFERKYHKAPIAIRFKLKYPFSPPSAPGGATAALVHT